MSKKEIGQRLRRWLDDNNYRYSYDPERCSSEGTWNIKGRLEELKLHFLPHESSFAVIGVSPRNADSSQFDRVVEYLTRVNYGLRVGNFEFDYRDGQVRYKTYHCLDDVGSADAVSDEAIRREYEMVLNMFERYGDGLVAMMDGDSSPEAEIEKAESDSNSSSSSSSTSTSSSSSGESEVVEAEVVDDAPALASAQAELLQTVRESSLQLFSIGFMDEIWSENKSVFIKEMSESYFPMSKLREFITAVATLGWIDIGDVDFYYDDTLLGGGEDGFMIVKDKIYYHNAFADPGVFAAGDVKHFANDGGKLNFWLKNGRHHRIDCTDSTLARKFGEMFNRVFN